MRLVPEGVQNQHVQPLEHWQACVRNLAHVGAISQGADSKSEDRRWPVLEPDRKHALAKDLERDAGLDRHEIKLRNEAAWRSFAVRPKCVAKNAPDCLLRFVLAINRHWSADPAREEPCVIETEEVVGMSVGEGDCVDQPHALAEKLHAHFGCCVDQQVATGKRHEHAGPCPLIPGVARGANVAIAANHGDARGRSSSQKDQSPRTCRLFLNQATGPQVVDSLLMSAKRSIARYSSGEYRLFNAADAIASSASIVVEVMPSSYDIASTQSEWVFADVGRNAHYFGFASVSAGGNGTCAGLAR